MINGSFKVVNNFTTKGLNTKKYLAIVSFLPAKSSRDTTLTTVGFSLRGIMYNVEPIYFYLL